jgi:hypothetical protein
VELVGGLVVWNDGHPAVAAPGDGDRVTAQLADQPGDIKRVPN